MQGKRCGLEEPCTVEVVCTVRWGGERSDALSLPDKRHFTILFYHCLMRRRARQDYHGGQGQDERVQPAAEALRAAVLAGRGLDSPR